MIDARSFVEGKGRREGAEKSIREEEAWAPTVTCRREEEQRGEIAVLSQGGDEQMEGDRRRCV